MTNSPHAVGLAGGMTEEPEGSDGLLGRMLIIDDDPSLRQMIITYFLSQGCLARGTDGSEDLAPFLDHGYFSLIVLDVHLALNDGFDLLRQIRTRSDIPVIMITGKRVDEIDRIVGLELGADDYVTKPFNPRELLARARAILRRHEMGRVAKAGKRLRGGFRFNGWELRRTTRGLRDPAGAEVELTNGDFALLVAFLEAPRRTLSREHLLQATRTHEDIYDRSIDVQVLRLRRKLEHDPGDPQLIKTERGIGYRFDAAVEKLF